MNHNGLVEHHAGEAPTLAKALHAFIRRTQEYGTVDERKDLAAELRVVRDALAFAAALKDRQPPGLN